MMSHPPWSLSAVELQKHYAAKDLSPLEVTESILNRVEALNPSLNAFIHVTRNLALSQASLAEAAFRDRKQTTERSPLLGVPISIKDNLATRGIRTTMGSLLFKNWVPDFDAVVVERVRTSGAVILGKTNTSEFGWKGDAGNRLATRGTSS
jgi:aspartyl-tRNA(Asn)/glutamyl-tRNA(Gln) amidotransferase subunit A